jgi:leader peptidase (prepilin peptidase)/N-methyltransferase
LLLACFGFLLGLVVGSFLNACIYRLPLDISLINPSRSFCPNCEKQIDWYDNLPVLSFVWLRGKCRHCAKAISWRYPVVELATGILFALVLSRLGLTWAGAKGCVFLACMVALMFTDLEERILPDEFTLGGVALGLVFAWFVPLRLPVIALFMRGYSESVTSVAESTLAAALTGGTLWFMGEMYFRIRHREGLGLGDVKLVAMIAAFLDLPGVFFTLIFGSILGVILGLAYIFVKKEDAGSYELPFGTFLCFAGILAYFTGEPAFSWYSGMS